MRRSETGHLNRRRFLIHALAAGGAGLLSSRSARADERLAGLACRSVHLGYEMPGPAVALANQVIVDRSAPGTYFCALGFRMGYFGIQELGDGKKLAIFSVWDPGAQDDPNAVAADRRVIVLEQGDGVRVKRFGNEGTGGQSFLDLDWKTGKPVRFLVTARVRDDRTAYTALVRNHDDASWRLMASFATLAGGALLTGAYSFVEDFRRNRVSATQDRRARFGPAFMLNAEGTWSPLASARFTADSNPSTAIDAGPVDDPTGGFFLATGGATKNEHAKLRDRMNTAFPDTLKPTDDLREQASPRVSAAGAR